MNRRMDALAFQRQADDVVVTVRSAEFWIASARVFCFSCAQLTTVRALLFPWASTLEWHDRAVVPADGIQHLSLIYMKRFAAPALAELSHLYEDYDLRVDDRYVMNHCDGCGAKFSDSKLRGSSEDAFNFHYPAMEDRAAFRWYVGPILATGHLVQVANHVTIDLSTTSKSH